jgi:ankyrin repeat protein
VQPIVAALAREHFQTADLLRHNGADADVRGQDGRKLSYARRGSDRILIEYDPADINARDEGGSTPLLWASEGRYFKDSSVVRLLLEHGHGADLNVQDQFGGTPWTGPR